MGESTLEPGGSTVSQYLQLDFAAPPHLLYCTADVFKATPTPGRCPNTNFLKGCKWSPDGASLLTASDDSWLRVFDLPADCMAAADVAHVGSGALACALAVDEGESVYDYAWYSRASVAEPTSCCFAASSRAHPVHLWDGMNGQLRCSYVAHNDVDEPTAAYSVAFDPAGGRLWCGYRKCVRIFDVARPGHDCVTLPTQRKKEESVVGIVSCFAFSGVQADLVAIGSYSGTVGVMDARTQELLFLLHGHRAGVTQAHFSPDGNYLYTGARQDEQLICWDVRCSCAALAILRRDARGSNQRLQFDIEPCGRHLVTGGTGGRVRVFDLGSAEEVCSWAAAADTVNGCACHPYLPLLAVATGERQYPLAPSDDDEGGTTADTQTQTNDNAMKHAAISNSPSHMQNCLQVWRCNHLWVPCAQPDATDTGEGVHGQGGRHAVCTAPAVDVLGQEQTQVEDQDVVDRTPHSETVLHSEAHIVEPTLAGAVSCLQNQDSLEG